MLRVSGILFELLTDMLRWLRLALRSSQSIQAENLFLRRQLALYIERGVKPRRIDPATRIALTLLSRLFDWRNALAVVRPVALIRWHRAGWKLFWRLKSRPGRPTIPVELQALIRRIANENPMWGEERIANELLLRLGIRVSPRTVNKYLPWYPGGRPRGDLRWSTFLRLHAQGIIACDFFVSVTATFRLLYVFVVIEHHSRRLIHYPPHYEVDDSARCDGKSERRCGQGHSNCSQSQEGYERATHKYNLRCFDVEMAMS
jgi:putative transposase